MGKKSTPLWLWPNTLSLDAPLVAVAWVWMLKKAFNLQYIEPSSLYVLFGAVWSVYVIDRIVDVWFGKRSATDSYRHRFSWEYRKILLPIVLGVIGYSIYFSMYNLPATMLSAGIAVIISIFLYLLSVPFQQSTIPYSKNLAAGMIFAMGVAIPARMYQFNSDFVINDVFYPLFDDQKNVFMGVFDMLWNAVRMTLEHIGLVIGTIETVTFGLLCMLNITACDLWENSRKSDNEEVKATNELILTMGIFALIGFCLFYTMFGAIEPSKPYFYAIMAACGILQVVNRVRTYFTLDGQRVLADIALLAPILFFYLFTSNT